MKTRNIILLLVSIILCIILLRKTSFAAESSPQSYWVTGSYKKELLSIRKTSQAKKNCSIQILPIDSIGRSREFCVVVTGWGLLSEDGYVRIGNSGNMRKLDIPQNVVTLQVAETTRLYVKQLESDNRKFKVGYYDYEEIKNLSNLGYQLKAPSHIVSYLENVKTPDNNYTEKNTELIWDSVSFSENGQWIVGKTDSLLGRKLGREDREITRVALNLSISKPYSVFFDQSEQGSRGRLTFAITKSGRYVTEFSTENGGINIYDINGMSVNWQYNYNSPDKDDSEGLRYKKITSQILGGANINNIAFSEDEKYLTYELTKDERINTIKLTPSNYAPLRNVASYLGLGDSFSSGEGVLSYRSETDFYQSSTNYNLCHQSKLSYPYLIAEIQNISSFGSITCSGAVLDDVYYLKGDGYSTNNPQAKGKRYSLFSTEIESDLLPGYIDQKVLLNYRKPEVATISVGGNNIGFKDIITACIINKIVAPSVPGIASYRNCYSDRKDRESLANQIDNEIPNLTSTFKELRKNMSGEARLYVLGYPKLVNPTGWGICGLNAPLTGVERKFADDLVTNFNQSINIAAQNAGAKYVDVSTAFVTEASDYRLCGNQNDLAVNGITLFGPSRTRPTDIVKYESFHPNLLGHILLTRAVRNSTNDLTSGMPSVPQVETSMTSVENRVSLVGDAERKVVEKTEYKPDWVDTLFKDMKKAFLTILKNTTKGTMHLWIHSDPVLLGEFPIDSSGKVQGEFKIPPGTPVGYHQIHLKYVDDSGQEHDDYAYVFVAASDTDYDGDGIPNDKDDCPVSASVGGMDIDNNGIDDACGALQNAGTGDQASVINILEKNGTITSIEAGAVRRLANNVPSGTNPQTFTLQSESPETQVKTDAGVQAESVNETNQKVEQEQHKIPVSPRASWVDTLWQLGIGLFVIGTGVALGWYIFKFKST